MLHQALTLFDDVKEALAFALHEAGENDTAIGLAIGLPPANIRDWRQRKGLSENLPPESPEVAAYRARADVYDKRHPEGSGANVVPFRPAAAVAPPSVLPPSWAPAPATARPQAARLAPAPAPAAEPFPLSHDTGVHPTGENALEIGTDAAGNPVLIDLQELLATRLLVQGNSGSGKSHLLRRLIEQSADVVQQIIIDPEGDFATLAEAFAHTVIEGRRYTEEQLAKLAGGVREHRASVVLSLEGLDAEQQMELAAAFLNGLFDAPREHWNPALVIVDEAQIFAPSNNSAGEESREARRVSGMAMTNLMSRGRKRGLAGIVATQRLAKLSKNVAAEASNFLMGRTFLDLDIARAGDLLGLKPAQAEAIRDLSRGEFLALGPAVARRPAKVTIGSTVTTGQNAAQVDLAAPLVSGTAALGAMLSAMHEGLEEPGAAA